MFADIAMPKNNEEEFIGIASRLNTKKLCFLYDFDDYNEEKIQKTLSVAKNPGNIDVKIGFIVNQKNMGKASKYSKLLVAKSSDKDRLFIESGKIKIIYGFEEVHKKDYLHQRASGLNHILCRLANKNKVSIGLSYSQLFDHHRSEKALILGRVIQNIRLCQSSKASTRIGCFSGNPFAMRAAHDISSLFKLLGMSHGIGDVSL